MNRHIIEVPQGQDTIRSVVRIEDDPSAAPGEGVWAFSALGSFLQVVLGAPHMLRHATDCPVEVHITHNGGAWVLETVSYVTREPDAETGTAPPR